MDTMIERKYALTKIAAGDYLLPSNDAQAIWRIATYEDGPSHGISDWPTDRTFWGIWLWPGAEAWGIRGAVEFAWDRWNFVEGQHETRADAIRSALQLDPSRT